MSHPIVVSSSVLSGGVLTITLKVANDVPSTTSVQDFTLNFAFAPSAVTNVTATGPATGLFTDGYDNVGGTYSAAWADGSAANAKVAGQTVATISFTLAAAATSLNVTYSGEAASLIIPSMPILLADNSFNSPVQGNLTITGTAVEDQTLTANSTLSDFDHMGTISHQWLRDGSAISGATAATYVLVDADVSHTISVRATFVDGAGNTEAKLSAVTSAVGGVNDPHTGNVAISGSTSIGATLTANTSGIADADGVGTFSYQWSAGGTPIAGATSSTYQLTAAEEGKTMTVKVDYTDGQGFAETATSAESTVVVPNQAPTGAVTINDTTPTQNQLLTASNNLNDPDGNGTVTYQWSANGVAISGANAATFTVTEAQVGQTITVTGSYQDGLGKTESVTSAATSAVANVNDAPTGAVTIAGTAREDQTLSVSNTLADLDGLGTVSYQWKAGGVAISGATGTSLVLTQAQVGKAITVTASYTDGHGAAESVTSAASASVVNVNDTPAGSLTITGTAIEGQTLSVSSSGVTDEDGLGTFSFQWRVGTTVVGTGASLVLTQAQVGQGVTVRGSYTDGQGTAETVTGGPTSPVGNVNDAPGGSLTISGVAVKGQTLTAVNAITDEDGLGTGGFIYHWLSDGVHIPGATASTYVLTAADVTHRISVSAMYTDGFGQTESVTSAQTAAVILNNFPTGSVAISDTTPTQNQTLTASNTLADADGMGAVSYQWMANDVNISGATAATFTVAEAQVGKTITVKASYTDNLGTAESVSSAATSAVANVNDPLTGDISPSNTAPSQGQTITVSNTFADADGLGTVAYQWFAAGTAISGATSSSLVLTQAQVGKAITVRGSYTDGHGTAESKTSTATAAVKNVNDAPVGRPTISNTAPSQRDTLTANTSGISDADGLGTFSFQWLAGGVAITGATTASLSTTEAMVGKALSVQVKYTDALGAAETVTSLATAALKNVNDAPTGAVTVDGARVVGMALQSDTSTVADIDGLGTFSYQWFNGTTAIAGATASKFTPTAAEAGKNVSVKVTWTDGHGTVETLTSAAVAVLQEDNVTPLSAPSITPVAGDGNGDGIKDSTQVAVVSAPLALLGSSNNTFVTLVADATATGTVNTGSTAVIQTLDQEAAPANKPGKMDAPMGLIDFTASTTVGQTETFSLFVDRALGVNGYWKQDGQGVWVNLASKPFGGATTAVGNKIRLDFKITDGGQFDNDHKADGIITDPAVIGTMPLSVVGYAPDVALAAGTHFFF